jgi:peptidoglycan/LPS O-acetylase OafA/YrhL
MNSNFYRADIDGLRAIAILGVVFFHFNIYPFEGGYLGVDVFLVISGYLIASFILPKLENDNFNFFEFFLRRVKRLLPTYYITLILSFIMAYFVFEPDIFDKFAKSSNSSMLFISNFFFWKNSGYWDESNTNPLLHTWTLSLEWQFYFFISIFFYLGWKFFKNYLKIVLLTLFVLSLTLSIFYIGRDVSFFLIPFRLFEFLIGSFIFLIKKKIKLFENNNNIVSFFGFFLIIFSFINFSSASNVPGYISLIPCLGTAIILNQKNSYLHHILSNTKIVYIGLISYSLYLFHWPIVTYYSSFYIAELKFEVKILLLIFSLFLSAINYELVEKKIRKLSLKFISKNYFFLLATVLISIFLLNFFVIKNNGLPDRISHEKIELINSFKDEKNVRGNFLENNIDLKFDVASKAKLLVLGDSHGEDMFMAIKQNIDYKQRLDIEYLEYSHWCFQKNRFKDIAIFLERIQMRVKKCRDEKLDFINNSKLLKEADIILLSSRWYKGIDTYIEEIINYLKKTSEAKIIVSSKTIFFPRMSTLLTKIEPNEINEINMLAYDIKYKAQDLINAKLKKKLDDIKVQYLDKSKLICNDQDEVCNIYNKNNNTFNIFDGSHWTLKGAKYYGNKIDFSIFE